MTASTLGSRAQRGRRHCLRIVAGLLWARLMAEGKMAGRPRSGLDMIIAAVAGANDCVVVTDNEKDFVGLQIINPLRRGLEGGGIEQ